LTQPRRGGCALWVAALSVAGGLGTVLIGFLLAHDLLVVGSGALRFGTGLRPRVSQSLSAFFGFHPDHDVLELLVAGLAIAAVTFGAGILFGRWSAR
jgi:hypothetical protein